MQISDIIEYQLFKMEGTCLIGTPTVRIAQPFESQLSYKEIHSE